MHEPTPPSGFRDLLKDVNTCANCRNCIDLGSWGNDDWLCGFDGGENAEKIRQHLDGKMIKSDMDFFDAQDHLVPVNNHCICDKWEGKNEHKKDSFQDHRMGQRCRSRWVC